jgi:hypothetical protein
MKKYFVSNEYDNKHVLLCKDGVLVSEHDPKKFWMRVYELPLDVKESAIAMFVGSAICTKI